MFLLRDLKNVSPGCENLGLVIPKHKFSHEPKAHFHDSETPVCKAPVQEVPEATRGRPRLHPVKAVGR